MDIKRKLISVLIRTIFDIIDVYICNMIMKLIILLGFSVSLFPTKEERNI